MSAHYTYFNSIIPDQDWQKMVLALVLGLTICLVAKRATARLQTSEGVQTAVVPSREMTLFGFFDMFLEGFVGFHDSILGKANRHYVPFTGSIFLFIFLANLLGLIPGMPAITTTIWVNVGMAIVVFVYFNWEGIKANGVGGYLKHFMGPIPPMAPVIFILEIISTCLRIITLNLRLYWNITADHTVLGIFVDLTKFIIPCFFYAMGTFVAFMQAFVFTMLTMVYILLATQHEEEHH